jgi:DNA-binding NarL/FixJ family response regulator
MEEITVLLAEDHAIVRKGLRSLLDKEDSMRVIGEASDGREAIEKTQQLCPDIVLMDIGMPSLNGLEATRRIAQRCPESRILILTVHSNEEYGVQIQRAGAAGYVVKRAAPEELIAATLF